MLWEKEVFMYGKSLYFWFSFIFLVDLKLFFKCLLILKNVFQGKKSRTQENMGIMNEKTTSKVYDL